MRVPNTIQTEKELRETLDLLFAHSKKVNHLQVFLNWYLTIKLSLRQSITSKVTLVRRLQGLTEKTLITSCKCLMKRSFYLFGMH